MVVRMMVLLQVGSSAEAGPDTVADGRPDADRPRRICRGHSAICSRARGFRAACGLIKSTTVQVSAL